MAYYALEPAYGRDYASRADVIEGFLDGKDFIGDMQMGFQICNREAFKTGDTVQLRYKRKTQLAVLKLTDKVLEPRKRWDLYWSPEGKRIAAGVQAADHKAAIRKAPAPYNKKLGEIYATEVKPGSVPEPATELKPEPFTAPFKVEVIADSSGKWCGNGLTFETEAEATTYGSDLCWRWTAVRKWRVIDSAGRTVVEK